MHCALDCQELELWFGMKHVAPRKWKRKSDLNLHTNLPWFLHKVNLVPNSDAQRYTASHELIKG